MVFTMKNVFAGWIIKCENGWKGRPSNGWNPVDFETRTKAERYLIASIKKN